MSSPLVTLGALKGGVTLVLAGQTKPRYSTVSSRKE